MGLGNRTARRHQTAKTAGVNPEDYWDFTPGQTVMTVDGFLGKVEAVFDGPVAGYEEYQVTLVNGLGGGTYTASQLQAATDKTAKENTASVDYPELSEILQERLDPGRYPGSTMGLVASKHQASHRTFTSPINGGEDGYRSECDTCGTVLKLHDSEEAAQAHADEHRSNPVPPWEVQASLQSQAEVGGEPGLCENGHLTWGGECASCRNADVSDNAMVTNPGDHKPQDVEKTGGWSPGGVEECDDCGSAMHTSDEHDLFQHRERSGGDEGYLHDADNPYETCSWCTNEVLDDTLKETNDGARICPECWGEHKGSHRTARRILAAWDYNHPEECDKCSSALHTTDEHDLFEQHGQGGNLESEGVDENRYDHIPALQAPEGDAFSITRCDDHGTKGTGDLRSQHHYLDLAHEWHDAGEHGDDGGVSSWSCCPNMQIAHPGELESGKNYTASKTAGMHGMPLFEKGDRVVNFRGEGGTVEHVQDSGHPGKSNRVSVTYDGQEPGSGMYGPQYYESGFEPHPDAPQEQHDRYHQRKADNQAATDLLSSVESQDPNTGWAFSQHDATRKTAEFTDLCEVDEDNYCRYHGQDADECEHADSGAQNEPYCDRCGDFGHDDTAHEKTCPLCGNGYNPDTGEHPYNGEGPDLECPNGRGMHHAIERKMKDLDPGHYCSEHCHSADAQDIVSGYADNDERVKNHKMQQCIHCGEPLPGSVGDQIGGIGTPSEHAFLKSNPTGPTKYSKVAAWEGQPCQECGGEKEDKLDDAWSPICRGCWEQEAYQSGASHAMQGYPSQVKDISPGVKGHYQRGHDEAFALMHQPGQPSKYSALEYGWKVLQAAQHDPSLAFHVTAAWRDVRDKAKRIRTSGGVHITTAQNGYYIASVQGDHGTYESVLMRAPGTQKIAQWDCGCKWAKYHWGAPDDFSRFSGRMCSHALALTYEAQSRGMFGREIRPNQGVPRWLNQGESPLTSMERGFGHRTRLDVPTTQYERTAAAQVEPWDDVEEIVQAEEPHTGDRMPHTTFLQTFAALAVEAGEDPARVAELLAVVGAVSSPFGEPAPHPVPGIGPNGPTEPRRQENPASAGFLTSSDPDGWDQQNPQDLGDRVAHLDDALFEPEMAKEAIAPLVVPLLRAVGPQLLKKVLPGMAGGALTGGGDEEEEGGEEGEKKGITDKIPGMQQINDFARGLKSWTDQSKQEGMAVVNDQNARMLGVLQDQPEPALPETYGAEEDDLDKEASTPTGVEYAVPTDPGQSGGNLAPGTNLKSDPEDLEPEDPSFVSTGSVGDIVAEFQRTAGAAALATSGAQVARDNAEIAQAAQAYLSKEAMATFTPAQQQELINEGQDVRASNLDRLEITGTHYEALDALQGEDDDEEWLS